MYRPSSPGNQTAPAVWEAAGVSERPDNSLSRATTREVFGTSDRRTSHSHDPISGSLPGGSLHANGRNSDLRCLLIISQSQAPSIFSYDAANNVRYLPGHLASTAQTIAQAVSFLVYVAFCQDIVSRSHCISRNIVPRSPLDLGLAASQSGVCRRCKPAEERRSARVLLVLDRAFLRCGRSLQVRCPELVLDRFVPRFGLE